MVLIKPAEGVSCASILADMNKRVKSEELGVTVQEIRETPYKNPKNRGGDFIH